MRSTWASPVPPWALAEAREEAKGSRVVPLGGLDRLTLARISAHREKALSLARAGDLDEAAAAMNAARLLISVARFSANGEAGARTLHYAAISYLSYRRGNFARARAEMVHALRETDRISRQGGDHPHLAARRVHLVHNIMKVDLAARSITDVLQVGFAILRYLAEGPANWPSEFGPGPECRPDPPIARYHTNKIMDTIAEAIEDLPTQRTR